MKISFRAALRKIILSSDAPRNMKWFAQSIAIDQKYRIERNEYLAMLYKRARFMAQNGF